MDDGFAKGQLIEDRRLDEEPDAHSSDVVVREKRKNVGSGAERLRCLSPVSMFVRPSSEESDSLDQVEDVSDVEGGVDGPSSSASHLTGGLSKRRNSFHISHSSRKGEGGRRRKRCQNVRVYLSHRSNVGVGGTWHVRSTRFGSHTHTREMVEI